MASPSDQAASGLNSSAFTLSSPRSSHVSPRRGRKRGSFSSLTSSARSASQDREVLASPPQSNIQVRSYHFSSNQDPVGSGAFSYSESSIRDRTALLASLALQEDEQEKATSSYGGLRRFSSLEQPSLGVIPASPTTPTQQGSASSSGPSNLSLLLKGDSPPDQVDTSVLPVEPVRKQSQSSLVRYFTPRRKNSGISTASPSSNKYRRLSLDTAPDNTVASNVNEQTPLLSEAHSEHGPSYEDGQKASTLHPRNLFDRLKARVSSNVFRKSHDVLSWHTVWLYGVARPVSYIPAVILGLLLNILDAISYGMIMFPLYNPIFADFGPDGVSMFFVSTIIAQIVYSGGGSIFKGGNGSMMIEIVPFLHIMADTITREVGTENANAVIATTIVSFAISTILTGVVFLILGACKLGKLIEFFPRHILVGCIGGVGWFLVTTGLEVSSRMEGEFEYDLETFRFLTSSWHLVALWASALGLALLLKAIQLRIKHPLVTPIFFLLTPIVFYIVVVAAGLDLETLRQQGWIFEMPRSNVPWYHFYSYYDFSAVDWTACAKTIPAMLALTFFGILHVPINVPALGVSIGEDNVDTNRELVAHGISNLIAEATGTIENYLVYTNSVLFIRTGGDSHIAGFMLAAATAAVMAIGPWIIGYIPVMVVGSLIFLLGIELVQEAVIDVRGRVHPFEYFTIFAIIVFMSVWDFVIGIFIGIILACLSFVVMNSRRSAIRAILPGSVAKSAVRRHFTQQRFLRQAGEQIVVLKLQGYLFFGTISAVEKRIRDMLDERRWAERPIRFLVMDFGREHVAGLDFSAAEAFLRIRRLLQTKNVMLVLCGADGNSEVGRALRSVGIWDSPIPVGAVSTTLLDEEGAVGEPSESSGPKVFETLNDALEWCENELLRVYYSNRSSILAKQRKVSTASALDVPSSGSLPLSSDIGAAGSPRTMKLQEAARSTLKEERSSRSNLRQPLPLLLTTFQEKSGKNEDFFYRLVPYFKQQKVAAGTVLWRQGDDPDGLYLIESGILRAMYSFDDPSKDPTVEPSAHDDSGAVRFSECILPGTVAGELGLLSGHPRNATVLAERQSTLWLLSNDNFRRLWNGQLPENEDQESKGKSDEETKGTPVSTIGAETAHEFVSTVLALQAERTQAIMTYLATLLG